MYSVRVFEEGKALNKIFEDIMKFKPDRRKNVIYEVEDGDYAKEVRKIVGRKLIGTKDLSICNNDRKFFLWNCDSFGACNYYDGRKGREGGIFLLSGEL